MRKLINQKQKEVTKIIPCVGQVDFLGILVDEKTGERRKLHQLSNKDKEFFFKNVFQQYKRWKSRKQSLDGYGYPTDRTGIYLMLYSLLDYRLETLWLNHAYLKGWGVFDKKQKYFDKISKKESTKTHKRFYALDEDSWKKRRIPSGLRKTGTFLIDLYGKGYGKKYRSSNFNNTPLLSDELMEKISRCEDDRKELIHRNLFFMNDITDEHIESVIKIFREIDKMVTKHQKDNYKRIVLAKIP